MSDKPFEVAVMSGTFLPGDQSGAMFDHRWTGQGVAVETEFTGGHLLHVAIAGCVLNDLYREAEALGMAVDGVRVGCWGDFDRTSWQSTGVSYRVEVSSALTEADVDRLLAVVDDVAEMPKTLRNTATVTRVS